MDRQTDRLAVEETFLVDSDNFSPSIETGKLLILLERIIRAHVTPQRCCFGRIFVRWRGNRDVLSWSAAAAAAVSTARNPAN